MSWTMVSSIAQNWSSYQCDQYLIHDQCLMAQEAGNLVGYESSKPSQEKKGRVTVLSALRASSSGSLQHLVAQSWGT